MVKKTSLFSKKLSFSCTLLVSILFYLFTPNLQAGELHDLSYLPPAILAEAETFKTPEYRNQWALEAMNAAVAYAYGATGSGQTIALIDAPFPAGVINAKLENKLYFSELMTPCKSLTTHSYQMASLMIDKKDTHPHTHHGLAFESAIVSYDLHQLNQSITHALKRNIKIFNNSWRKIPQAGGATVLYNPLQELHSQVYYSVYPYESAAFSDLVSPIRPFKEAVQSGAVFVWSTGNEAAPQPGHFSDLPAYYPSVTKGWLAVTATNQTGQIASYANHCGKAKAWCLAAPGGEAHTPIHTSTGTTYGTSVATAYVSGAIALLKSRFSTLSEQEIAARLLYTANKEGIYANQEIYGQGALDLAKASMPIGETYFVEGTHTHSPHTIDTQNSFLSVMSSALEEIIRQVEDNQIFIFDQFQRAPFKVSLAQFIRTSHKPNMALSHIQHHVNHLLHHQKVKQGTVQYQFSLQPQPGQKGVQTIKNLRLTFNSSPTERYGFYLNQDGGDLFGQGQQALSGIRYAKNPYLSFSQQGAGGFYQRPLGKDSYLKIGFSQGNFDPKTQENQPNQGKDYYAAQVEIGKRAGRWLFSSQYATIYNKQGLFQLAGQGGFALADQTHTQLMHAGLEFMVNPALSWKSNFYYALSHVKSSGMIRTPHPITSQAFHSGLHYQNKQQAFGLYLYQPLTITKGKMTMRAVTDITSNNELIQSDYHVNIKHRRRYQLEAFYHHHFKHNAQLILHANYGKRSTDNAAYLSYLKVF
jgi:hypothetical protein